MGECNQKVSIIIRENQDSSKPPNKELELRKTGGSVVVFE